MLRLISLAVALALVLASPSGAAEKVTWYDRFGLWNGCRPVDVLVVSLSDDAGKIGRKPPGWAAFSG